MAKRHTCWALSIDEEVVDSDILLEQCRGVNKFGRFNSWHEAYAIMLEELDEFWESVKANDPDPRELLQIAALARRALLELCEQGRQERERDEHVLKRLEERDE